MVIDDLYDAPAGVRQTAEATSDGLGVARADRPVTIEVGEVGINDGHMIRLARINAPLGFGCRTYTLRKGSLHAMTVDAIQDDVIDANA